MCCIKFEFSEKRITLFLLCLIELRGSTQKINIMVEPCNIVLGSLCKLSDNSNFSCCLSNSLIFFFQKIRD